MKRGSDRPKGGARPRSAVKFIRRKFNHKAGKTKGRDSSKHQENIEDTKKKWLHHRLKVLRKVLKKAKVFEVRKVQRRIAQARDVESAAAHTKIDVPKLQAQLESAKALDLDQLAQQLAQQHGLVPKAEEVPATQPNEEPNVDASLTEQKPTAAQPHASASRQLEVTRSRLMKSGSVRKELAQVVAEFNKRFQTALKAPTTGDELSPSGSEDLQDQGDGDDTDDADADEQPRCVRVDPDVMTGPKADCARQPSSAVPQDDDGREESEDSGVIDDFTLGSDLSGLESNDDHDGADDREASGDELPSSSLGHGRSREHDGPGSEDNADSIDSRQWDLTARSEDDADSIDSRQWDHAAALDSRPSTEVQQAVTSGRAKAGTASAKGVDPKGQRSQPDSKAATKVPTDGGKKQKQPRSKASPPPEQVSKKATKKSANAKNGDPLLATKKQKNRLGQHARRKLAEQMFGREAKHLAMLKEEREKRQAKGQQQVQQQEPEQLHPSWAAKRKQMGALTIAPAGKKIKFDDPDENVGSAPANGKAAKQEQLKQPRKKEHQGRAVGPPKLATNKTTVKQETGPTEPLHPSWEARKRQRAIAASMPTGIPKQPTGKKIVFED